MSCDKPNCGCSGNKAAAVAPAEGPSDLLYDRMDALGLTTADVERFAAGMTAELEASCACCADKGECRHDLAENPDDPNWKTYCPNATSLEAFRRLRGRFPA